MKQVDLIDETTVSLLFNDLSQLIEQARAQVYQTVNSALTLTYWHIGQLLDHRLKLSSNSANSTYGDKIIYSLSRQLTQHYGRGFSEANLFHFIRFFQTYPQQEIV